MGRIEVSTNELRRRADELIQLSENFKQKVEAMRETEAELSSMWEGQANKAFHKAFAQDMVKFDLFAKAIYAYAQVIIMIANNYDRAENANTATATARTYGGGGGSTGGGSSSNSGNSGWINEISDYQPELIIHNPSTIINTMYAGPQMVLPEQVIEPDVFEPITNTQDWLENVTVNPNINMTLKYGAPGLSCTNLSSESGEGGGFSGGSGFGAGGGGGFGW